MKRNPQSSLTLLINNVPGYTCASLGPSLPPVTITPLRGGSVVCFNVDNPEVAEVADRFYLEHIWKIQS